MESPYGEKLFKINDDVFLICLSSAPMLFCVLVRSSKLGSLSPRIPLHPFLKDAQEYTISKNYTIPTDSEMMYDGRSEMSDV